MPTNSLSYVDYDFDHLVTELQQLLAAQPAWKDMYRSSTGQTLLELFAAVGNLVLYYIERRAEESYIGTAQNYSSIVNLVRLLNYIPTRNISSVGPLTFTLDTASPVLISIPQWASVSSTSGVNFLVLDSNASIGVGGTSVSVTGIQGTLITKSFISNGATNQTYNMSDTQIENSVAVELLATVTSLAVAQAIQLQTAAQSSYTVTNDDGTYSVYALNNPNRPSTLSVTIVSSGGSVVWNQQSSFINSTNTSKDYVLRPELDGTLTVVFGNGVFGAFPNLGETVIIQYVQSAGLNGNVFGTGQITTINTPIYYAGTSTPVTNITVTNTDSFLGGANAETIDEIRENAPAVFSTGDRAVTKSDFVALIQNYSPGCNVVVYGENDSTHPNYDLYNQVQICMIVPTANISPNIKDWGIPTSTFESTLAAYLYSKSMITVRYSFVTPTIVSIAPSLTVRVSPTASVTTVEGLVEAAVQGQFALGTTTSLGQSKYNSDIVDAIEDVPGVLHCHAILKAQKDLVQGYNSNYTYATNADLLPVLAGRVELWVGTAQVAVDDGAGGWTNLLLGYTVTGLVEYAAVNTTSSSGVTIGTGHKTFTITAGLAIALGTTITAKYNGSNHMTGTVYSYSSTTLVINVTSVTGSGTYSSWTITDNDALIGVNISPAIPVGSDIYIKYQQDNSAETVYSIGDLLVTQTQICQWDYNTYDYIGY